MSDDATGKVMSGAMWDEFCDGLKEAGRRILANAPEDVLSVTEGYRYLARMTRHALNTQIDKPDPAYPAFNFASAKIGADNPDFIYGSCAVRGSSDYLIKGRIHDAFNFSLGAHHGALGSKEGLQCAGFLALPQMDIEADGSFEIAVSTKEKPGNWLRMIPETNTLLARCTVLDRKRDTPPELSIERLGAVDESAGKPCPLTPQALATSLGASLLVTRGITEQFFGWTNDFRAHPNQLRLLPAQLQAFAKGDPNTIYRYAYFDLREGEALVVDLKPPQCQYWNIQVANHWMESLEYLYYTTAYNHSTVKANEDGSVRIVIAKHDPGVTNWIDTAGHDRGCVALRWVGAENDSEPICSVRTLGALKGA